MRATGLTRGFVPLVDAAPLLVAQALSFAREEGLDLTLITASPLARRAGDLHGSAAAHGRGAGRRRN